MKFNHTEAVVKLGFKSHCGREFTKCIQNLRIGSRFVDPIYWSSRPNEIVYETVHSNFIEMINSSLMLSFFVMFFLPSQI